MSYLENNEAFLGTGDRNSKGQTLEEFLAAYNPKKYDCPSNTVDILIFRKPMDPNMNEAKAANASFMKPKLKLLLVRRSNHPSIGFWATPGGFVNLHETLRDAAARELQEETGVKGLPLAELRTWDDPERDPRWRVITTSFVSLIEGDQPIKAGDDAADAAWFEVSLDKISEASEVKSLIETYSIHLDCSERDLHLSAEATRTIKKIGCFTETSYAVLKKDSIAVDHPLLILDAWLYIQKCANANCSAS